MDNPVGLMLRDATEFPPLVAFLVLPVAVAIVALRRGSRLALVPIAIFIAQIGLWFTYYATDWFFNPGGPVGLWIMLAPALVSLGVAAAALRFTDHRG